MGTRTLAVVAVSMMVAACGSPSSTAPDLIPRAASGEGALTTTVTGCAAQAIQASYTPRQGRHVITVVYLDARGNDIAPIDCPAVTFSVRPDGARVEPLFDGSREITQGVLIVTGATQVYTVTATAGTMTSSVGVLAGR
jgi:hypothetical protein